MKYDHPWEKALVESGIAAVSVLHTTVETECQYGNPKNIPISILVLYMLSMVPQLQQMEYELAPWDKRVEKANAIAAAIMLIERMDEEEGHDAITQMKADLKGRPRPMSLMPPLDDLTYGGMIPA